MTIKGAKMENSANINRRTFIKKAAITTTALLAFPDITMPSPAIYSGLRDLDQFAKGFKPGSLSLLVGRPAMGKTAFAINTVRHASMVENKACLYFSFEMSGKQLCSRFIAPNRFSGLRLSSISKQQQFTGLRPWRNVPFYVDDTPAISLEKMRDRCDRFAKRHPNSLIIVDYLELMPGNNPRKERSLQLAEIVHGLRDISRDLGLAILILGQVPREIEYRRDKRPLPEDLNYINKYALHRDLETLYLLYREDVGWDDNFDTICHGDNSGKSTSIAEMNIVKPQIGERKTIYLSFSGKTGSFGNYYKQGRAAC